MEIEPGLEATLEHVVGGSETARAIGSGDVEVLGTPFVVTLFERAAVAALAGALGPGDISVGVHLDVEHIAPTPVGGRIIVTARLESVEGRRLGFGLQARDGSRTVARGTHTRMVLDRARFIDGMNEGR